MNTKERKIEAERIATAHGVSIKSHNDTWTGFILDDGVEVDGRTYETVYNWSGFRFEGMVAA